MSLSNELISQFVKAAKEEKKANTESTVYGTIVYDGRTYVQLDGSEILTPVETTADTVPGNRVTVLIKDHTATVTGNLSAPALNSSSDVVKGLQNEITEVDKLVANKVDAELLVAEQARIDTLVADNVTIKQNLTAAEAEVETLKTKNATIRGELDAAEADIEDLSAKKLNASDAIITYATIENLNATNADVHNLEATYGEFQQLTADKLDAVDASITRLQADKLDADTANITYAKITDLEAVEADIESLDADVANIDTLIFGSASGDTIQSSFANAVIAQLGNAQIKSAMIENVSADKITAGDIITDNVRVKSQNGLLLISDETIQISDDARVRVQIGKDAANDYSINVWDAEGNLMFSKGGITDSAIKDAIIRNDMVSDTANIAAHKLDIDSLFEEINGSTNTIKSTKVYLDDEKQTLDVAFKTLETDVTELGETVTSQGTQISTIQGQITSKIWQQDINTATNEMSTQYSTLEQEIDGVSATVASHTSQLSQKADSSTVTTVSDRVAVLETNLDGFESTVSSTYATKTEVSDINIGGRNLLKNSKLVPMHSNNSSEYPVTCTVTTENGVTFYRVRRVYSEDYPSLVMSLYSNVLSETINHGEMTGRQVTLSFTARASHEVVGSFMANTYGNASDTVYFNKPSEAFTTHWKTYYVVVDEFPDMTNYKGLHWNPFNIQLTEDIIGDFYLDIRDYKFELGNKPTDWLPAPEDVDSDIATAQAAAEAAQATANQNAADMASIVTNFNADVENLQTQIDGSITTWFYEVAPTTSNAPASSWTTTDLKNVHLGDLYYDTITGYCYRWQVKNNTYSWQRITDTDVTKALADAQTAQDTADQKRRVFYSQPTVPYDKGDLWVQGSGGDILRCKTAKTSVQSYAASDWVAASKYTDDTVATTANNNALAAQSAAANAQADIDNLEIGGRNLILNSSFTDDSSKWSYSSVNTFVHVADGGYSGDGALQITVTTPSTVVPRQATAFTFSAGTALTCSVKIKEIEGSWSTASYARWANLYSIPYVSHRALNDDWILYVYSTVLTEELTTSTSSVFGFAGMGNGTFLLDEIKLEKGSRATDWTAAPEDLESEVSALETRVTTAETSISQNTQAIALRATKTEVATAKSEAISTASSDATTKANNALSSANTNTTNLLKNYSTTSEMNAAIELSADSITSSVSSTYATKTALNTTNSNVTTAQTTANQAKTNAATAQSTADEAVEAINSMEIGGRNLLRNSSFTDGTSKWSYTGNAISIVDGYSGNGLQLVITANGTVTPRQGMSMTLKTGDSLTGSVKVKVVEGDFSGYQMRFAGLFTMSLVETKVINSDWTLYIYRGTATSDLTFTTSNMFGFAYGDAGTYIIDDLKLEKGTKATDWTPAPEDVADDISGIDTRVISAESSITQLSNKITSNVTATNNLGTRMTTVEQTAEDLTVEVADAAKTATNYLNFSSSGLVVGDHTKSSLGKNVLIDSDSVDIRNGSTVMASFGANKVTLGQNSADSVIDLCDGAGRISALISEASTSYPEYDSIEIASQEINTSSQRFVTDVTNSYNTTSTPSIQNDAQIYMLSDKSSAGSFARMEGMCTTTSTGAELSAGVSAIVYDKYTTTRMMVYAHDSTDTANRSNQINVYPHKTTMNRSLYIDGIEFSGSNKVLWSGGYYMSAAQTATLSEAISAQANGIVLVWSYYVDGASDNSNFHFKFIPKHFVSLHNGKGTAMLLSNASLSIAAGKYVYISNTSISGYSTNDDSATAGACGLTSTPKNFVLRYVIGV